MTSTRVLLIDAFNLIRRIYEARPDSDDKIEEVIQASANSVTRALNQHSPSHGCVVFDSHDTTWRHLLYREYKQGRKPTPEMLLDNVSRFKQVFSEAGLQSLAIQNYEADDIVATLAAGVAEKDGVAIILSSDKSYLPLLSDKVRVYNHFEKHEINRDDVLKKYGVTIGQLTTLWAMAGDASNNVKGVPKVGKKTAVSLIEQYGSLKKILNDQQAVGAAAKIRENRALVLRCRQLVTLKTDVELGINLRIFRL